MSGADVVIIVMLGFLVSSAVRRNKDKKLI